MEGSTDLGVVEPANNQEALLITCDKDFGDLVFNQHYHTNGVILLRLPETLSSLEKAELMIDVINAKQEELILSFTVMTINKRRTIKILHRRS